MKAQSSYFPAKNPQSRFLFFFVVLVDMSEERSNSVGLILPYLDLLQSFLFGKKI